MIRKIARFSRMSLATIAVVGLVALTVVAMFGEGFLRGQIEKRLSQALNRNVRVGALAVDLAAREVALKDVVIPGLPSSKRASVVAPEVRIALSFRSLITSRIVLRGVEFEKPAISVQVFPDGSTDWPEMAGAQSPATRQISIEKLVVQEGNLFLNDQKIPVEIAWPDFEGSLVTDSKGAVAAVLSAGPGPMRFGDLPEQEGRLQTELRFADSTLFVDQGSLAAASTRLSLTGRLDLRKEPRGEIRITGPLDLENFDQKVVASGLALKGSAQTDVLLSLEGGNFSLKGTLKGLNGSYDSVPIDTYDTSLSWDGSDLHLKDLALEALGGKALLDIRAPDDDAVRVSAALDGMSAEPLLHWLFDYGGAGLGARVSGPVDLSFPRGKAKSLSGTADLQLSGDPSRGDPVSGRLPFKITDGTVTFAGVRLEGPKTAVTVDGSVQPDKSLGLEATLLSEDLATTDTLGLRLRNAFGAVDAHVLGAGGNGSFRGRVSGTLDQPVFTGRFSGTSVSYLGVSWGAIDWAGTASTLNLRSDRLVAVRGGSHAELSGSQGLGEAPGNDAMDLNIALKEWPAKDLLRVVDSRLDVEAPISGTMRLLGTRSQPLGNASLASEGGKALGIPFVRGDLKLQFEGEALRVESLKAVMGGGELQAKGRLMGEGAKTSFEGDAEVRDVEISDLGLQDATAPMVGGHISGRVEMSGPLERPKVAAHLESPRVFYGDEGLGAMNLDIAGAGDGLLNVTARSDSPRFRADVTGSVEAKSPYSSRLEAKLTSVRIDPVLRALGSRFENAVVITASANARLLGPLADPASITAQIRDGRLRIAVPDYAIEAAPGSAIEIEKGEIRVAGLTLAGEGTSLNVSGKIALKREDVNDLAITGRTDLRVFSGFLREWRLRGAATMRSQIGGTFKAIRVSGGLDIEDGAIRLRTFPQGLDGLSGRLVFNETQARIAGLEGRFGGGRVSVSGQMGFGGPLPSSFDLLLSGDSLGLRYPEGLRSTFGASLRLQGTLDAHWLTGQLLVSKAIWTRKYAITSELLGSSTIGGFANASSGLKPSPMRLDITIKAPGTLRVDNNLASLVAKADLTLTGSPTEPQLLGRVELEHGKVFFRGNTYEVRKGLANFSNPREINPVFDIEADTRVRNYRLTLLASGTVDRVSTRITSDPPLTSAQIASLLTSGSEGEASSTSGSGGLQGLSAGGTTLVSSVFDDLVTSRVAQGFGLSRLSIDTGTSLSSFARGARLTVGKRVTNGLEVIYSGPLAGGTDKVVTVEYSLSNRFSLLGSWEEPRGFGVDARTRFVLGRK